MHKHQISPAPLAKKRQNSTFKTGVLCKLRIGQFLFGLPCTKNRGGNNNHKNLLTDVPPPLVLAGRLTRRIICRKGKIHPEWLRFQKIKKKHDNPTLLTGVFPPPPIRINKRPWFWHEVLRMRSEDSQTNKYRSFCSTKRHSFKKKCTCTKIWVTCPPPFYCPTSSIGRSSPGPANKRCFAGAVAGSPIRGAGIVTAMYFFISQSLHRIKLLLYFFTGKHILQY